MKLSRLLDVTNVSLTTSGAAVTAPADLEMKIGGVIAGARSGGAFVEWERGAAIDATYFATCLDSKEAIDLACNKKSTPFYAKVGSGTATLEVEWWG